MIPLIQKCSESFLSLLYPPLCVHCNCLLHNPSQLLCEDCLIIMELIDPNERCPYCFSSNYCPEQRVCQECQKKSPILHRIGSAFDYTGPAASLIRHLKYGNQKYLARGCGAYLAAQFLRLEWPMPDVIIPVPIAFNHWVNRGFNQCELLANHLGDIIKCPVVNALRRRSGDYSQAGLNREQRMKLIGNTFELRKGYQFYDKTILLVDDVMTTGSTMRKCAEQLYETYPESIYGITVCRSDHQNTYT